MVFAAAQRLRPSMVLGPVDLPPCILHTLFPLTAGQKHCFLLRFDIAWQRAQRIRPPANDTKGSLSVAIYCYYLSRLGHWYSAQHPMAHDARLPPLPGLPPLLQNFFLYFCCITTTYLSTFILSFFYIYLLYFIRESGKYGNQHRGP